MDVRYSKTKTTTDSLLSEEEYILCILKTVGGSEVVIGMKINKFSFLLLRSQYQEN